MDRLAAMAASSEMDAVIDLLDLVRSRWNPSHVHQPGVGMRVPWEQKRDFALTLARTVDQTIARSQRSAASQTQMGVEGPISTLAGMSPLRPLHTGAAGGMPSLPMDPSLSLPPFAGVDQQRMPAPPPTLVSWLDGVDRPSVKFFEDALWTRVTCCIPWCSNKVGITVINASVPVGGRMRTALLTSVVLKDGTGHQAGVRVGDCVVEVEGEDVTGLTCKELLSSLKELLRMRREADGNLSLDFVFARSSQGFQGAVAANPRRDVPAANTAPPSVAAAAPSGDVTAADRPLPHGNFTELPHRGSGADSINPNASGPNTSTTAQKSRVSSLSSSSSQPYRYQGTSPIPGVSGTHHEATVDLEKCTQPADWCRLTRNEISGRTYLELVDVEKQLGLVEAQLLEGDILLRIDGEECIRSPKAGFGRLAMASGSVALTYWRRAGSAPPQARSSDSEAAAAGAAGTEARSTEGEEPEGISEEVRGDESPVSNGDAAAAEEDDDKTHATDTTVAMEEDEVDDGGRAVEDSSSSKDNGVGKHERGEEANDDNGVPVEHMEEMQAHVAAAVAEGPVKRPESRDGDEGREIDVEARENPSKRKADDVGLPDDDEEENRRGLAEHSYRRPMHPPFGAFGNESAFASTARQSPALNPFASEQPYPPSSAPTSLLSDGRHSHSSSPAPPLSSINQSSAGAGGASPARPHSAPHGSVSSSLVQKAKPAPQPKSWSELRPGDLIWGRIGKLPKWPGLVHQVKYGDGEDGKAATAGVKFFGDNMTESVALNSLEPLISSFKKLYKRRYEKAYVRAVCQACRQWMAAEDQEVEGLAAATGVALYTMQVYFEDAAAKAEELRKARNTLNSIRRKNEAEGVFNEENDEEAKYHIDIEVFKEAKRNGLPSEAWF